MMKKSEILPNPHDANLYSILKKRIDSILFEYDFSLPQHHSWNQELKYPLIIGGKRIRAVLTYLVGLELKCSLISLDKIATSLELIHAYSLVHDDLPCMDDDCFRRGVPSSHKKYGEASAVLIGDALLAESFVCINTSDQISMTAKIEITKELSLAASGRALVLGQWLDIHKTAENVSDLEQLHSFKTGALFGASLCCPALLSHQKNIA